MQIEPSLGLDHFARANLAAVRAIARLISAFSKLVERCQGMSEQTIAQQNAERISPARIDRRLRAPPFRFVHDVVMHERGDVNQLDDDGEIDMPGGTCPARAAGQQARSGRRRLPRLPTA